MTDTEDFQPGPNKLRETPSEDSKQPTTQEVLYALMVAVDEQEKRIAILTELVGHAFLSGDIVDWPTGLGLPNGWVDDNHTIDPPARQIRKL